MTIPTVLEALITYNTNEGIVLLMDWAPKGNGVHSWMVARDRTGSAVISYEDDAGWTVTFEVDEKYQDGLCRFSHYSRLPRSLSTGTVIKLLAKAQEHLNQMSEFV